MINLKEHDLGDANTLLEDGEMKQIKVNNELIVLARRDDNYYAFDPYCTHYGAPLNEGVLHENTVICPWHHACFDIHTGIRQEPPALDSIASYPVRIIEGHVMVELEAITNPSPDALQADKTYVIVGGGAAGEAAAEELRRTGFAGNLVVLSASANAPVDRPNLSKDYLAGDADPDWIPLRSKAWYEENRIDLQLNTRVTEINTEAHVLKTSSGRTFHYDKVLLASGSKPLTLSDVKHIDLENIFTLRRKVDADDIISEVEKDARIVVIGASFIGMEVAASLGERGASVTVIDLVDVPFEAVLGKRIGQFMQQVHEDNGIRFKLKAGVKQFHGENGAVTAVELSDGTKLPADTVIIGIGVKPATAYLSGSGIDLNNDDQSILVDQYLQTSAPDVYAAGDIARYPVDDGDTMRIEHWRTAQQHGFVAAHNMLGQQDTIDTHVPFFWTSQWGTRLRYVGHANDWDRIVYRGSVDEGDFIAFYLTKNTLQAALGVGHDADMAALEFVLKHDLPLSPDDMQNAEFDLIRMVSSSPEYAK